MCDLTCLRIVCYLYVYYYFFFFFQAEDGIRDHCVTGVQTCALPISSRPKNSRKRTIVCRAMAKWCFIVLDRTKLPAPVWRCSSEEMESSASGRCRGG